MIRPHTSVIERTFGQLKARWMCLNTDGGQLPFTPEKVCRIIPTGCVLHNLWIMASFYHLEQNHNPDRQEDAQPNAGLPGRAAVLARYASMRCL